MRILLVEDEARLRQALVRALRDEGYAADMASTGEEGLYKAENSAYDAVLLDVMLPVFDGWEVLRRLRQQSQTPVLMLTGCSAVPDRVRGLNLGADDYLAKPFDVAELLARLRAVIRRSAGQPSGAIALAGEPGGVSIDTNSRLALRGGQAVALTAREYSLLEYLALHRGKVVSRSELYDHLVDENDDSLSNVMDVHVFGIRKKLGQNIIKTRRGQGYWVE
jgi:two-component system OmpR family response regulator